MAETRIRSRLVRRSMTQEMTSRVAFPFSSERGSRASSSGSSPNRRVGRARRSKNDKRSLFSAPPPRTRAHASRARPGIVERARDARFRGVPSRHVSQGGTSTSLNQGPAQGAHDVRDSSSRRSSICAQTSSWCGSGAGGARWGRTGRGKCLVGEPPRVFSADTGTLIESGANPTFARRWTPERVRVARENLRTRGNVRRRRRRGGREDRHPHEQQEVHKRFDVPEMTVLGLDLDPGALEWDWKNNTLIVTYKKPPEALAAEVEEKVERQRMRVAAPRTETWTANNNRPSSDDAPGEESIAFPSRRPMFVLSSRARAPSLASSHSDISSSDRSAALRGPFPRPAPPLLPSSPSLPSPPPSPPLLLLFLLLLLPSLSRSLRRVASRIASGVCDVGLQDVRLAPEQLADARPRPPEVPVRELLDCTSPLAHLEREEPPARVALDRRGAHLVHDPHSRAGARRYRTLVGPPARRAPFRRVEMRSPPPQPPRRPRGRGGHLLLLRAPLVHLPVRLARAPVDAHGAPPPSPGAADAAAQPPPTIDPDAPRPTILSGSSSAESNKTSS